MKKAAIRTISEVTIFLSIFYLIGVVGTLETRPEDMSPVGGAVRIIVSLSVMFIGLTIQRRCSKNKSH